MYLCIAYTMCGKKTSWNQCIFRYSNRQVQIDFDKLTFCKIGAVWVGKPMLKLETSSTDDGTFEELPFNLEYTKRIEMTNRTQYTRFNFIRPSSLVSRTVLRSTNSFSLCILAFKRV